MTKSSVALVAVPLATSILLAGCGGDTKPDASRSSTASPSPTATATAPSTSASPTSTSSPTPDPNVPAAARAHTPAGAEAFVRYFYSQLNVAWNEPKAGLLSGLSEATCRTCAAFEASAIDLASKHQHYQGNVFAVATIASIGESEVLVVGEQPPGAVLEINGSVVKKTTKTQKSKFVVAVAWFSDGWRIHEMKVMK